jgi:nitrogen fixation NifU-like protein
MTLDALYREVVLDHHRNPRGCHDVARIDARAEGYNPSCGDEVEVQLELTDGRISDVGVRSRGCAISVASGSMLAELLEGRSLAQAARITAALQRMLRGETEGLVLDESEKAGAGSVGDSDRRAPAVREEDDFEDLEALAGVRQLPARIKCAALPWMTLLEALDRSTAAAEDSRLAGSAATTESNSWGGDFMDRSRGARAAPPKVSDGTDQ